MWEHATSTGTAKTYETALKTYKRFCSISGEQSLPHKLPTLSEELLIILAIFCCNSMSLKHATIKIYLSGIRFHYIKSGAKFLSERMERLGYIMKAIKRRQDNISTIPRLPITAEILSQIITLLQQGCFSPHTDLLLRCACLTAFYGFLRCGEFTINNSQVNVGTRPQGLLLVEDVLIKPDRTYFFLHLKFSKTDPYGKGVFVKICENTPLCPVDTMLKYIQHRLSQGAHSFSPLFVDSDLTVLTRNRFIGYVHHLLNRLGIDVSRYNGHSFRIGAATSAAAAGVEDHLIQLLGRWSSTCYIRYIHTSEEALKKAQQKMISTPP